MTSQEVINRLFVTLSASCAHVAPEAATSLDISIPVSFTLYGETAPAPDRWWEGFGSGELNRIIDQAFAGNLTLQQSMARLEQSRALAVQAGADLLPDLIPMAVSLGYGILFATLITLLLVPCLYMVAEDFSMLHGNVKSGWRKAWNKV